MRAILDFIVEIIYFIINLTFYLLNLTIVLMFNGCAIVTIAGVIIKLFLKPELAWMDVFNVTLAMLTIGGLAWLTNLVVGTIKAALENYMRFC